MLIFGQPFWIYLHALFLFCNQNSKMSCSKLQARLKVNKDYKKTVLKVPDCFGVADNVRTQQMINTKREQFKVIMVFPNCKIFAL